MTDPLYTNRLAQQKSPYLLQHAHNPVDWYPWGEEAFAKARSEDKPIFLSIGYATCHWCHVMERETFENVGVAQLMNQAFINIKVDREELPEVDSLYMEFAQSMMPGSAGWPLNVLLTPSLQPFFAATYLPPQSQHGLIGMRELISRTADVWKGEEKERLVDQAAQIVEIFLAAGVPSLGNVLPDKQKINLTAELLFKMADPVYGGMKGSPKFPIGYQVDFLLGYSLIFKETRALFIVERTLEMMHRGGIYDHIGGGFSRYSVDERWLVPHFEKMLYDNAILAHSYLLAWQVTKNPLFAEVSSEILDYLLRDMRHPAGGFYSAEDADSEGREGYFYTWTPEQIAAILPEEDAKLICEFFAVRQEGNFEGRSIIHTPIELEAFAADRDTSPELLKNRLDGLRQKVWKARELRMHPIKDDKVLSAWNGLMIHALVRVGAAFGEQRYIDAAVEAARFLKRELWRGGHLLRRWREGEASFRAGLEDYATVIRGLISLVEADCGSEWLAWALELTDILAKEFKMEGAAFYQTDGGDSSLILRKMQFADGAEPSGNAIHCENLMRLEQLTRNPDYRRQAEDIFKTVKKQLDHYPPGYIYHLLNLLHHTHSQVPVLIIALNNRDQWKEELMAFLNQRFIPQKMVIWRHPVEPTLFSLLPYLTDFQPIGGQTTLYICKEGACLAPIHDLNEMAIAIAAL